MQENEIIWSLSVLDLAMNNQT